MRAMEGTMGRVLTTRRIVTSTVAVAAFAIAFVGLAPADAHVRSKAQAVCTIAVNDDAYSTPQDTALDVPDIGVVANDEICGTDGLVISESSPSHGALSSFDDDDGGFHYVPDPGFVGTDTFTYSLEDVVGSPVASVTITVGSTGTTATSVPTTTTVPVTTATTGTTASTATTTPPAVAPANTAAPVAAPTSGFTG
jgi:hypothetical protein